jgi:hypothetical protein
VNASAPGQAAFERIRHDIESGLAHWVERGPYGLQPFCQRAGDEDDETDEPGGWSASHTLHPDNK